MTCIVLVALPGSVDEYEVVCDDVDDDSQAETTFSVMAMPMRAMLGC